MAKATGIVLTGVAIGMGNEYVQGYGLNIRMGMAGLGAALFLTGVEKLSEQAGVGLAVITFITIMLTPFKGKAPAQELVALIGQKGSIQTTVAQMPSGSKSSSKSAGPAPGITMA